VPHRAPPDRSSEATARRPRRASAPRATPARRGASSRHLARRGEDPTLRVLFFNEGNLGTYILGQGQLDAALRAGLATAPDVDARFAELTPMGRWARAVAIRPIAPLARASLDFRTLRWHFVQSLRARAQLREELSEWPADVAHVHSNSIALAMVARMHRIPVALSLDTTVHDWWAMPAWHPAPRYASIAIAPSRALERRALRAAALVLAWTGWARRAAEREAPGARVIEHHPGIDLRRYRPLPRRERARPRVLFVGGRFAEKGGDDLLAALGEQVGLDVDLDLVTPVDVAERPGVRVHRLAPSDARLLDLQQQADVLCLPTYGDTNPWALVEAMACGTPVVSTRVGGIPDLLDDGAAGVLAPYGDPRALGEAIRALLADPQRRAQLAGRARRRCEERYDARRQFARLVERLREVSLTTRHGLARSSGAAERYAHRPSGDPPLGVARRPTQAS
jgi:glycosyltransferase involved in cell wall biosynthesis